MLMCFRNFSASRRAGHTGALVLTTLIAASGVADAQIPTDGLIGYWKANGNANDSSSIGNHGTYPGAYVPGRPGGCQAFDLATGQVRIPDHPEYDFQNLPGWTVGFWFDANGIPRTEGNGVFIAQDHGSGYQPKWFIDYGYSVFHPTTSFMLHFNDYNQERIFIGSDPVEPFPTGWNQLTVAIDNVGRTVAYYLNGQSIGTRGLPTYVLQPTADLVFGYAEPGLFYDGLLDDVVLYNRALPPQDVARLMTECAADFNADCQVDFYDYLAFVDALNAENPAADVNGDNLVDFFDYLDFLSVFEQGCP
jgi:hypothetical protein